MFDLPLLHVSQSVWRFSNIVSPPLVQAIIWSASNATPCLAGLRPHPLHVKESRAKTRHRSFLGTDLPVL
jgi:hypothetical protein